MRPPYHMRLRATLPSFFTLVTKRTLTRNPEATALRARLTGIFLIHSMTSCAGGVTGLD